MAYVLWGTAVDIVYTRLPILNLYKVKLQSSSSLFLLLGFIAISVAPGLDWSISNFSKINQILLY